MSGKPPWFYRQSGVVAVREAHGTWEVLLVLNRKGTRWVIPKGVVEPGLAADASAAKEAWEEAGVRGTVSPEPIGVYLYAKWGGTYTVEVYRMEVEHVDDVWPEADVRERRWLPPRDASALVREEGLKDLIRSVEAAPAPRKSNGSVP